MKLLKETKGWFQKDFEREQNTVLFRLFELEEECVLMERFIANQGKEIPQELLQDLSELSVFVDETKRVYYGSGQVEDKKMSDHYQQAMRIHNRLSMMATPANAVSIKYTEYTSGFFFKRNTVVNTLIALTFFCLALFIITKSLDIGEGLKSTISIIAASGLGAGFYTLSTVRKYLINRTYNPRYNPTYIIRFFLGLTAGSILAYIFSNSLQSTGYDLTVDALAVVGGFAADAVSTILQRISEVLIATFKGVEKGDNANGEIIKAEKEIIKQKVKIKGVEELAHIKSLAVKQNVSDDLIKQIDECILNIEKS